MAEMILRATGSKLKIISEIHVTSTQAQYDTCLFEFDEEWEGYGMRTAVFYSNPNNIKAMLLDINNRSYIPWDAFSMSRYLYIGVYGSNGESYLPTQFVEVMYQPGANQDDHLYPPTPGIYEQIAAGLSGLQLILNTKAPQSSLTDALNIIKTKADKTVTSVLEAETSRLETAKADKADLHDLEVKVENLAIGSPKEAYATLQALQTAFPGGDSGTYVVAEDGHWYYWTGGAWVSGGVYQSTGIADKTISPVKTDFLVPSKNLFNKERVTHGFYVGKNTGDLMASTGSVSSDFIPVSSGMQYIGAINVNSRYAFYSQARAFISGGDLTGAVIAPAGAAFIRFSFSATSLDIDTVQFEQGSTATPYAPYGSTVARAEMVDLLRKTDLTFITPSGKNLFNRYTAHLGKYITTATGELIDYAGYISSDFISVKQGKQYTFPHSSNSRIVFYREDKGFVSGGTLSVPVTIPAGASFLRFCFRADEFDLHTMQFEAGTEQTPFEPYGSTAPREAFVNLARVDEHAVRDTITIRKITLNNYGTYNLLEIYVPTLKPGSAIMWRIGHQHGEGYEIWRTLDLNLGSGEGADVIRGVALASGEFDMALKIQGRPDFIGGSIHGDELMEGPASCIIDGSSYDLQDSATWTVQGREIRILTTTTMTDPADGVTVAGKHRKEMVINAKDYRIINCVEWSANLTMDASYMAMLPVYRKNPPTTGVQVTDRGYNNVNYTVYDLTEDYTTHPINSPVLGATRLYLYGTINGLSLECEVEHEPMLLGMNSYIFAGPAYNKMYFDFCGDSYQVQTGDVWQSKARYRVTYKGTLS